MDDVARKPCPYCKEAIAATATRCRFCDTSLTEGQSQKSNSSMWRGLAGAALIAALILIAMLFLRAAEPEARRNFQQRVKDQMDANSRMVAEDFAEQYEMARRNLGSDQNAHIELSVKAGIVAEAFLQAGDEVNYRKWKAIAEQHGQAGGLQ